MIPASNMKTVHMVIRCQAYLAPGKWIAKWIVKLKNSCYFEPLGFVIKNEAGEEIHKETYDSDQLTGISRTSSKKWFEIPCGPFMLDKPAAVIAECIKLSGAWKHGAVIFWVEFAKVKESLKM
jgi:hypothetical protein